LSERAHSFLIVATLSPLSLTGNSVQQMNHCPCQELVQTLTVHCVVWGIFLIQSFILLFLASLTNPMTDLGIRRMSAFSIGDVSEMGWDRTG
jgi:hypothetical protein